MDFELPEEYEVNVGIHQRSVLSHFVAIVVDVVTELARACLLSELPYADDFILMSETIYGLRNIFCMWKEVFESKCLKVTLGKTKVMVSRSITKNGLSKSTVDPRGVCCFTVKYDSVVCVQCGMWIHDRCVGVKRVNEKCS